MLQICGITNSNPWVFLRVFIKKRTYQEEFYQFWSQIYEDFENVEEFKITIKNKLGSGQ